jgi:hypothetical protein
MSEADRRNAQTGSARMRDRSGVDDARAQLEPYLLDGESLLWWGRPDPTKHLGRNDIFLVPFSLLWGGFAIFWEIGVLASGAPAYFGLFGLVFVAIGLYMIFGRFIVKARRKLRTAYGLTDQRVLVAVGSGALSDTQVARQPIDQRVSRNGRHMTVVIGRPAHGASAAAMYANTGMEFFTVGSAPIGFYDVADVAGLKGALGRVRR